MFLGSCPCGTLVKDPNTQYYGRPILFRVIGQNHPGYPAESTTLIMEFIEKILPFDGTEPSSPDGNRRSYGNNRWDLSNLRQWCNTSAPPPWWQASHSYDQPPDVAHVYSGYRNEYHNQSGFLANFSPQFQKSIIPTEVLTLTPNVDGTKLYRTTDLLFPLSRTEVGLGNENGSYPEGVPFPYFSNNSLRIAKVPAVVNANSYYKPGAEVNWYYWLRSAYVGYSCYVRLVNTDGSLSFDGACSGYCGLRLALNLPSRISVSDMPDSSGVRTLSFGRETLLITGNKSIDRVFLH